MASGISHMAWRWRHKVENLGTNGERPLSAFDTKSEVSTDSSDPKKLTNLEDEDSKPSVLGANLSVKTYYEGPKSRPGYLDWVDYPPKQMSKSAAKAHDRVAIKMFKTVDSEKLCINGRRPLTHHAIEIQNRSLVAAIAPILEKEAGLHLDVSEPAKFQHPFRPLYFCADAISSKYRSLPDADPVKKYLLLLIKVMDEILDDIRTKVRTLQASGDLVTFRTAWAFFPRRGTIFCQHQGLGFEYLAEVIDTRYDMSQQTKCPILVVVAKVLRFTGESFAWGERELEIPAFPGHRPIRDLKHCYPLAFVGGDKPESIQHIMADRGQRILDYQGLTYCMYRGIGAHGLEKHNVDERILVDYVGYNKHCLTQSQRETNSGNDQKNIIPGTGRSPSSSLFGASDETETEEENKAERKDEAPQHENARRLTKAEQERNKKVMLRLGETLMYMYPMVQGYGLKTKLWLSLYIDDIRPMIWNDKAYDHLVYDEQQKDLVLSFVESHGNTSHQPIEDVIKGKGQGLILLLSGPPGTGKTLTAEAVADRTHRPLFYLQAEDLGSVSSAAVLGSRLKQVLEMATEWNAVVLLDEADVFMAERHPQDVARNELVSIFLRELEYFRGILFLTTNLGASVDGAFRSRVNLHLTFRPLTPQARETVWGKFLGFGGEKQQGRGREEGEEEEEEEEEEDEDGVVMVENREKKKNKKKRGGELDLSGKDMRELALWPLNGREIKNAAKMVRLWCEYKGYPLTLDRLENGIKVTSPHAVKGLASSTNGLDGGRAEDGADLYDD